MPSHSSIRLTAAIVIILLGAMLAVVTLVTLGAAVALVTLGAASARALPQVPRILQRGGEIGNRHSA